MTVTYTAQVATCRGFGCFLKLLFRWRGSIYKLVWLDLTMYLLLYYILNFTYRWLLDEHHKRIFEDVVYYCHSYSEVIPLSFVLGFYVTVVMNRWWGQYTSIPWPDPIAVFVSANIHGQDDRGRLMRRTAMRYVCLCLTMVFAMVSPRVKKRFPTLDHLVEAGLLLENEKQIMDDLNNKFPKHSKHWLPIVWSASIVTRARKEGRIRDDFAVKTVIDELNKFRGQCGLLISYDTISVPLVYTQVVTLAVYSYFMATIMGGQWTEKGTFTSGGTTTKNKIDIYFPIFLTLQFFFYMGWLKVAESLVNPFGEDDDDFEVNWIIDRNLQVSYMIVDEMHHEHPELIRDQYWDDVFPTELPYTVATEGLREEHPLPSTAKIEVPQGQQGMLTVTPSSVRIDEMGKQDQTVSYKFPPAENLNEDAISGIHFTASNRSIRRKPSISSGTNQTAGTSLQRVASVASTLKKFFKKDDDSSRNLQLPSQNQTDGIQKVEPAASNLGKFTGSIRITDQVIEELDEQNTITSMATKNENRPTAESVFGPPPASNPVDMPKGSSVRNNYPHESNFNRGGSSHNSNIYSSSAPVAWGGLTLPPSPSSSPPGGEHIPMQARYSSAPPNPRIRLDSDIGPSLSAAMSQTLVPEEDTVSIASSEEPKSESSDHFNRLKTVREKERKEKYLQKLMARSVSAQQGISDSYPTDNDLLLMELTNESKKQNDLLGQKEDEGKDT